MSRQPKPRQKGRTMPNKNLLALFDAILSRTILPAEQDWVAQALTELAIDFDIPMSVVESALYSERQLVVYEP
jgi:hypothetical protein